MGCCTCKGIKLAVAGLLLVVNQQGWVWGTVDAWLLVGILLILSGLMKAVWPCCPFHGCGDKGGTAKKKGK